MKFQIRNSVFETNSSSTHCLILTNKKRKKKAIEKVKKEQYFFTFISPDDELVEKKDKILMLGGLFDYENRYGFLTEERKIFLKLLKDKNETELLLQVKENTKEYKNHPDEPYCSSYYYHNCLSDCTCCFYYKFKKYFKPKPMEFAQLLNDPRVCNIEDYLEKQKAIKKIIKENKLDLYNKLSKFIYEEGIIIPYDSI